MTDYERDAQTIRALWPSEHHRLCDSRKGEECDCYMRPYADADSALARLVAALSAATTERDEWKNDYYRDVAAHYDAKIAAQRRAEGLAAQLREARGFIERARPLLGIALRNSLGKQADDLYVAIGAALAAAAPATTLNEPGTESDTEGRGSRERPGRSAASGSLSAAAAAVPNETEQT